MSVPLWSLLAFALWTVLTLLATVGAYRWRRILTGRVPIREFRHGDSSGHADRYRRGMRAHANCVENLPVFAAVVLIGNEAGLVATSFNTLTVVFVAARVCQTIVHVAFRETNTTVSVRFAFFFAQLIAVTAMAAAIFFAAVRQ